MNGILIVDKPEGWTSHDVVAKLRGALKEKRIGHGGTLDPMATGVLPVFIGRATRAAEYSENAVKEYLAGFLPGAVTDTQDTSGTVLQKQDARITDEALQTVLERFTGEQEQLPPMYSAIKVNGRALYTMARKGIEVERKTRKIHVYSITYEGRRDESFLLRVSCSKGTYIRTLCHDIGDALGCGGCMSSLRRLRAGAYTISDALPMSDILQAASEGRAEALLYAVDSLFTEYPAVTVNAAQEKKTRNGQPWRFAGEAGRYRVYAPDGSFLMLGEADGEIMRTVKSFFEV